MSTAGRLIKWRCFLEGQEVEVSSVGCTGQIGSGANAHITIPFSPVLLFLKPRTLVHIFYFETDASARASDTYKIANDPSNLANWKLLLAGEYTSYSFANQGGQRHITLYVSDMTSYWDHAKIYFGSKTTSGGIPFRKAVALGGGQVTLEGKDKLDKPQEVLDLLQKSPKSLAGATGLLGGVISLLEAATGVYTPEDKKLIPGVNAFMSQAEVRLHLTRTIAASALDNTAAEFINVASFKSYFRRLAASLQQTASYMQLVVLFLNRVYYQWSSLPAPPYLPDGSKMEVKESDRIVRISAPKLNDADVDGLFGVVAKLAAAVDKYVEEVLKERRHEKTPGRDDYASRPGEWSAPEDRYTSVPDLEGHAKFSAVTAVTGFQAYPEVRIRSITSTYCEKARRTGTRAQVDASVNVASAGEHVAAAFTLCTAMINTQPKLNESNMSKLRYELEAALSGVKSAAASTTRKVAGNAGEKEFKSRLHTIMLAPDLFMCPPPKCNVLFPDDYATVRYGRQHLAEITRLLLHGRNKADQPTRDVYFSPYSLLLRDNVLAANTDPDEVNIVKNSAEIDKALNSGAAFILRHEKFCGIIADVQSLGDNDTFKNLHKKQQAAKSKEEQRVGDQAHLRRAADYMFFAKRFESRTAYVQARYLPRLIVGLPCLVLMPSRSEPKNPTSPTPPKYGTHLVGVISSVRHSGSQQGGSTDVQLTKCRTHDEVPSLFGSDAWDVVDKTLVKKSRKLKPPAGYEFQAEYLGATEMGNAVTDHLEGPDGAYNVMNLHPVRGRTYNIVPKAYEPVTGDLNADDVQSVLDFNNKNVGKSPYADGHLVVDGTGLADSGINSPAIKTDPSDGVKLNAMNVDVVETYTDSTKKVSKNSFENSIPPWYDAAVFLPNLIGTKFYAPLLGCTSILDKEIVDAAGDFPEAGAKAKLKTELAGLGSDFATVFAAAESLALTWLLLHENGADTVAFTEQYCRRAFGTITDILGTRNPYSAFIVTDGVVAASEVDTAGFHGDAYGNIDGMKSHDDTDLVTSGEIDKNIDPRAERYRIVYEYIRSLSDSGGITKASAFTESD